MKPKDIELGGVYANRAGRARRVTSDPRRYLVADWEPVGSDSLGGSCLLSTFARWAVRRLTPDEVRKLEGAER